MKKIAPWVVVGLLTLGTASVSRADPLIELGLAIDVSGSVGGANFAVQRDGYINVLSDASVVPLDGTVAVGVVTFSDLVHTVFPTTVLTPQTIGSLITSLQNMIYYGGSTAIGDAIGFLSNQILTNAITSARQVIDVSTDGDGNAGANQLVSADAAVAAGIDQINCLGIGPSAVCNFNRGTGSFSVAANTFAEVEASLARKIAAEVSGTPIPEPGSLAILGLGMAGLAAMRRRVGGWGRRRG